MTNEVGFTRRAFLAASAVGALRIARGGEEMEQMGQLATHDASRADDALLYVGTYTTGGRREGIHLVRLEARTGALRAAGTVESGPNPSFLALHPKGHVLYAVNEVTERDGRRTGGATAFAIAPRTGALSRLGDRESGGGAPCYASVDAEGRALLVANYVGGSVAMLPIRANGALSPASHVEQHEGRGPRTDRQEGPHAHCIVPDPSGRFALAADLGIDRVLLYRLDFEGQRLVRMPAGDAAMAPGAGPRHLAFHPTLPLVFVANELDSTVTTLRLDAEPGALAVVHAGTSTLPANWTGANQVADIHVAPSGRTLYVSNRGHDSIAVFAMSPDTGALSLEQVVPTGGSWPRNFALDPTGRWVLVANERSNAIVVLARDEESGRLTSTGERLGVPSPVCVRFRG